MLSDTKAVQTCGRIPGRISKCETQERNVGRPDVFRTQGARRRQAQARPTYRQLKAGHKKIHQICASEGRLVACEVN